MKIVLAYSGGLDTSIILRWLKDNCSAEIVAGRKSPKSFYDPKIATMESERSAYNQSDATGFIRLNALRLKVRAALKEGR